MPDWSISEILQTQFPDVPLRQKFRLAPYLRQVTLRQVMHGAPSLEEFLRECRREPQCGDLTVQRLREVLEQATATVMAQSYPAAPDRAA